MPTLTENNQRIVFNRLIDYDAEKVSQFWCHRLRKLKRNGVTNVSKSQLCARRLMLVTTTLMSFTFTASHTLAIGDHDRELERDCLLAL